MFVEILKSFPFSYELERLTESGAGRASVFYFPRVARVFTSGVRVFSGPSLVICKSWFRLMVINLRMNSWHCTASINREHTIMKGTAAAEALQTSFKYNLANKSRI